MKRVRRYELISDASLTLDHPSVQSHRDLEDIHDRRKKRLSQDQAKLIGLAARDDVTLLPRSKHIHLRPISASVSTTTLSPLPTCAETQTLTATPRPPQQPRLPPWPPDHAETLLRAYRRMCRVSRPSKPLNFWRRPTQPHQCLPATDCFFFSDKQQYGDLYLCAASGNVHLCTHEFCDYLIETREHWVCQLTDNILPLHCVAELDTPLYANDMYQESGGTIPVASTRVHQRQRKTHVVSQVQKSGDVKLVNRSILSKFADVDSVSMRAARAQRFSTVITTILANTGFIPTPAQLEGLIAFVERAWCVVVKCPGYAAASCAYTLENHCLVVLYLARAGFSFLPRGENSTAFCVIEKSQLLAQHMPRRDKCAPYNSGLLTDAEKMFKTFIDTCPLDTLRGSLQLCE